jgi:anti-sigma regulatory factor (Ser/Thr protein kinase)
LLGDQPRDDVAALALLYDPALADRARWVFPALPRRVRDARELARRWLERHAVGRELVDDVVLACDEACANAVEHGSRDTGSDVEMRLEMDERDGVVVTVVDNGTWRPSDEPRADRPADDGGHGLTLMHALMSSVDVQTTDRGTTVRMTRSLR